MDLGRIGIWTYHLNYQPAPNVREVAAELEELGYGALWIGESIYREPLTHAGFLLSATSRMVIATASPISGRATRSRWLRLSSR
jgi:alkanesulfonate monooxygenase SsuD/methylene tetrahydromethanopterin reductase-like flavin-dependent oxidoreductase (luciferase family)